MNLDLSTLTPPSPERTLNLAAVLPEVVRTLNVITMDHEALSVPPDADRLIGEVTSAVSRLPQLLRQAGAWLEREQAAGRIKAAGGQYIGSPDSAVVAARLRLDVAATAAEGLAADLDSARAVMSGLAAAETGGGSDVH